ncbi:hypothetical protein DR871_000245 [Flavobacterium petrolei]|jgi:hypothetical protein|uniref:Outer membrane protein beta-barrel domain-containing protein n=1 Tax=Flavobacterium petrolei TaxID=2259594 RepID=A0A482TRA0_9FLAO|nr:MULTISPECIES: hypothetical protein [Flavobacterium]QIH38246.1 hypothetical protein G7A72_05305 [Flavobacterium sp. Sr18]RYJ52519.1 hypothetical protein DR871_000245 [Flavobacterium petrolei]
MKNTFNIKTVFTTLAIVLGIATTSAQEVQNYDQGFRLGVGINGGLPLDNPYDFSLGADARLQYDLSQKYSLTLTTGFSNMFVSGDNNDLGYIPAKAGFKAFVLKDQLYLMGEVGAAFAVTNGYNDTSLLLSPSIGYATDKIDISLRYEHFNDFPVVKNDVAKDGLGQISLRLAYGFKL